MGFRVRKSINLGGGVKLNLNRKSVGISAGVKGARVSVNSKGRRTTTIGVPGTGVSYVSTSNISKKRERNNSNINMLEKYTNKQLNFYSKVYKITGYIFVILGLLLAIPALPFGIVVAVIGAIVLRMGKEFKDAIREDESH